LVARLLNTLLSVGTENFVKVVEGILGEDDESAEVTTRGELEEVKTVHIANINTGQVTCGSSQVGVFITIDNEGTTSRGETGVSHLVETAAGGFGGADTAEIIRSTNVLEGTEESLGGVNVE